MEKRLFLVAFFVCLGLTFVQLGNAANVQPSGIRENFRNFFDSIKQNDIQKTEAFRSFLEEEAEKEQHTFDMMKDELQITRQRNANRLRNLQHDSEIGERAAMVKRKTDADDKTAKPSLDHSDIPPPPPPPPPQGSTASVKVSTELDSVETFKEKMNQKIAAMNKKDRAIAYKVQQEWLGYALKLQNSLVNEQKEVSKLRRDQIKFKMPITISNAVDVFMESNDYKVTISEEEEKLLKKVSDPQRRSRVRLIKICEHILSDLKYDPYIMDLNKRINSPANKVLNEIMDESKRRNTFCNALIFSKTKRNRIHEILTEGKKLKQFRMFDNEGWNESINIFINVITNDRALTLSEEDDDLILEDKSVSTSKTVDSVARAR